MKKVISVVLALTFAVSCVFALSGCAKKGAQKYELVLITDGAPINDKAYNQSAWNGIEAYASEKNISCRYYQPNVDENGELTKEEIEKYIDLSVKNGAKEIVLPGEKFAQSAYEIAPAYSEVKFVLVDALPRSSKGEISFQSNVMCVTFDNLQAGYLAGYCSVIDGNTKLGYLGSSREEKSVDYGAGFAQGAAYAADQKGIPVYLDYANYDASNLDYDYSFKIQPVYQKVEEAKKKTFKVKVVDGLGSGVYTDGENVTITANPAPEGKVFDHWETKSDTKGVKDKKVNISHKKEASMNLLVGDCDCTITAVWADVKTYPINIMSPGGEQVYTTLNVTENSDNWVSAPPAPSGMVFDHWECDTEDAVEDVKSAGTNVKVTNKAVKLIPVYKQSDKPTFDVTVVNGTGSGSYVAGDKIDVVADAPKDGYMFYKWENVDSQGLSTGIAMENEYCYSTSFEMVDRYSSIVEKMFDDGTSVVFGGGNPIADSIFTATGNFDYVVNAFGYGYDESSKGNTLASVVNDYGAAIKLVLADYKGGYIITGNCSNGCIYVTGKNTEEFQLDEDGNKKEDKNGNILKNDDYNEDYANIYKLLSDGTIKPKKLFATSNLENEIKSNCLTLNYWVK